MLPPLTAMIAGNAPGTGKNGMRPTWHDYFFEIAQTVAKRATCDRAHVGCVIVSKDHQILSTGYNGSLPGAPHCDEVGHYMVDGHCVRTNHAEINAIAQAAKHGHSISDAVAYVTHKPCLQCARTLIASGIAYIYYDVAYGNQDYGQLEPYITSYKR